MQYISCLLEVIAVERNGVNLLQTFTEWMNRLLSMALRLKKQILLSYEYGGVTILRVTLLKATSLDWREEFKRVPNVMI